ncbi:MAG: response regulator [Velocimicrobium sp.]
MRVVVIEDEIRIREGICKLIQKDSSDWEVVGCAENGKDGYNLIVKLNPDLIITDIRMPEMDGLDMLEKVYECKTKAKAIVLSAYSEFIYAQQAIKLGVNEYLLKPIVINDFFKALKSIKTQIENDRKQNPESVKSLEQIFTGLIIGSLRIDEDLKGYLEEKYNMDDDMVFTQIPIYLGDDYNALAQKVKRILHEIMKEKAEVNYTIIEISKEQLLLIVAYGVKKLNELERWYQNRVLLGKNIPIPISCGWINFNGIENIKDSFQMLMKYMDWNIILGDGVMISYPKITQIQTVSCIYPIELENKVKIALCTNQMKDTKTILHKFNEYFRDGKVYIPKEIKECYIRFIWSMINIMKEIAGTDYNSIEQRSILENIINARTSAELSTITKKLFNTITGIFLEETDTTTLVVKRAKNMVHEFYYTGITLEEIALKLNITPEYLGTQFYKETGIHFSIYIKNYRIKKAKELLIGTTIKQYEVAQKVGYGDSKYFGRVFKECTGLRPTEYRNLNK